MVYERSEYKKKIELIKRAKKFSEKFRYPDNCRKLEDCFTEHKGKLVFWFTTEDNSTHAVIEENTSTNKY